MSPTIEAFHQFGKIPSWLQLFLPFLVITLYLSVVAVYRLYFHPLAKYPGPFFAKVTNWYSVWHAYKGDKHLKNYWAHKKYGWSSLHETMHWKIADAKDLGRIVRVSPNLVTINDPAAIRDIYGVNKNVRKSSFYDAAIAHAGRENIFNCRDRQLHARKRRILAPAFTEASLKSMEERIVKHIDQFFQTASAEHLFQGAGQCWTANIADWANYMTFDVMGDLVFGKDFGMIQGRESRDLPAVLDAASHRQLLSGCSAFMHQWRLDRLFFPGIVHRGSQLIVYAKKQVQMRLQADSSQPDFFSYIENAKEDDGSPAYDNPNEIFSEARTLIIGGSDTTAVQIAANFFYLTNNPQALAHLAKEIRDTFDSVEDIRLGQKLDDCQYLHAVVNETLRMSPSLPGVLPREVLLGGLNVAGEVFPPGVDLSVPIYSLHHNEDVYFEPHKYIPERWIINKTSEEAVRLCSSALTPFSYGSRQCIGKRLAMIQLYLVLAKAVWNYNLEYIGGGKDDRFGDELDIVEYKLLDHLAAGRNGPVVRFWRKEGLGK